MHKFIGLICAWGVEDWVELSIKQALNFCDEVIVSVGAHCEQVKKYEDQTLEICKNFPVKLVPVVYTGNHNTTKAATMNAMLKQSEYFKVDNWIFLLDVDEFYHQSDVDKLKRDIEHCNAAIIRSKIFFVNMEKYILGEHYRLWKITNLEDNFQPTNRWTGNIKPMYHSPSIMYHYTFLLNPYAKMDFWQGEHAGQKQDNKVQWMKNVYLKYDGPLDQWQHPSGPHNFGYPNERLLDLNSPHPEIIENSKWRHIKDFRLLYNQIQTLRTDD